MAFDIDARISEWQKNLLDTSRRNRLIKFTAGRGGGLNLLHPTADALWRHLVADRALTFPWKRDLLRVPAAVIDGDEPDPTEPVASPAPAPSIGPESSAATHTQPVQAPDTPANPNAAPPVPRPKTLAEWTAECRSSARLTADHLLTDLSDKQLAAHLLRLSRTATEAETDHGVSTLYAAFGFLRWYESADSQEELLSPLVLAPVRLGREAVDAPWVLRAAEDDPAANHCLAELLRSDFRLRLPAWDEADKPGEEDDADALGVYLNLVAAIKGMPRWEVVPAVALGTFNFQKLAMWEDLRRNAERVKSHALCRAVAGDHSVELRPPPGLVAAADLDVQVPPDAVTHILDADSSQHEAIEAVKGGADVVIDGPPGTGKSQTIANAIAELLAAGKTVLFVSEKTAALEVVKRRLDARGLGDFCLELHSHKANKRAVAKELGRCLELRPEWHPDVAAGLQLLANDRRKLNAYAAELHRPRPPLGSSAFQVHGELAKLAHLPERSRWAAPEVFTRDAEFLRRATETLESLARCQAVAENPGAHPWSGCRLTAVTQGGLDDARHHLARLEKWLGTLAEGTTLADLSLQGSAGTVDEWKAAVTFAREVLAAPVFPDGWLAGDTAAAVHAALGLHANTKRVRALNESLGAFDLNTVANLKPADVSQLAPAADARERLAGGAALSARDRVARLRELAGRFDALRPLLDQLGAALERLVAALLMPPRAVPVVGAGEYASSALDFAGPAVRAGWWDATRRAELQAVVTKARDEDHAARTLRAGLVGRLAPVAFAPESANVTHDALKYGGSFWRRLLPRWGALRTAVASWYAGPPPDRAGLLADLAALDAFHRRTGYVRQVEAAYAADLTRGADGQADWPTTVAALNAVARYEKWNPSPELKTALAPGGALDRSALRTAAEELARCDRAFKDAWANLLAVYAPAESVAPTVPAGALKVALNTERTAVAAEADALDRLTALLRPGADLPSGTWAARAAELVERVTLREQIARYATVLGLSQPVAEVEAGDWSGAATVATALQGLIERAGGTLTPATLDVLTDGPARERLRAAVRVSDRVTADGLEESWVHVAGSLFPPDTKVSGGLTLARTPVPELLRWVGERRADLPRVEEWVRYVQVRRAATETGVASVVEEVVAGQIGAERAADAFRARFLKLWLDELYTRVPELAEFSTDAHEQLIERFARLDRDSVRVTPARLRAKLLADAHRPRADGSAPRTSELGLLLREANKERRHMPVRRLFASAPTLIPRLKPCLMMSPLAVSTYLTATDTAFDVVIFDEASQVRPHDAVCAVYRGRQLVVAGDQKQLPPTDFFTRAMSEGTDTEADADGIKAEAGTAGFESLLDVCLSLGLVRKPLRWHYRSRREGLIAFSNRHFYGNSLVTFPSADDGTGNGVRFVRVQGGQFADGVNVVEARRVADLVIEHARASPAVSLGAIAFSQAQQNRILDELEVRRKANPELEGFFKEDLAERFFVKNLESVQGDERDAILLSVGYGPDAGGRVALRFGPLNRKGGERRLNVAVTRSRSSMTVVSSISANDIDLTRTGAEGAKMLREFLDFAERGPRALSEAVTGASANQFDSPFERAVCEELKRRGLAVHTQVGCGGFRIDMAVVADGTAGRYALGVECDGATYHASATARDRDRLRQEVLQGLGWRLCRIWSTDWLRNSDKQVQRVLDALAAPLPVAPLPAPPPASAPEPVPPAPSAVPSAPAPTGPQYASIDDVPEPESRAALLAVLGEYGAMEADDLRKAATRRLGFERVGPKIKTRLDASISALAAEQKLESLPDDRWRALAEPAPPVSRGVAPG